MRVYWRVVLGGVRRDVVGVVMHGLVMVILVGVVPLTTAAPAAPSPALRRSGGHLPAGDARGPTSSLHTLPSRQMTVVHPAGLGSGLVWVPVHRFGLALPSRVKHRVLFAYQGTRWVDRSKPSEVSSYLVRDVASYRARVEKLIAARWFVSW